MTTATNDPLLDELNGALTAAPAVDPAAAAVVDNKVLGQEQPPSLESLLDPVETAKHVIPPAGQIAKNADRTHAKSVGGHGYRVVIKGEYYAKSRETKGNVVKTYSIPFNLPELKNAKGETALGIIVGMSRPHGGMLRLALKKMDPLAVTARTYFVDSVTPLQGAPEPTSLTYMSFENLKKYVAEKEPTFPITDLDRYWDAEHLRQDLFDHITNKTGDVTFNAGLQSEKKVPAGFGLKKTAAERIVERHEAREEEHELLSMNEGLEA